MTGMDDPLPLSQQQGPKRLKPARQFRAYLPTLGSIGVMLGCVGVVVTLLQPKPAYEGRLVGEIGDVRIYAVPTAESEESLVVWRGGKKLALRPKATENPILQFDLSSADRQAVGSRHPDLVVDGWSGGMHCCLTRFIYDGPTGKFVAKLPLGGSGASRFVPLPRSDSFAAAFLAFDDVTLDGESLRLGTYLPPILLVWKGTSFGLYLDAMKATTPESHAPFLLAEAFEEAQLELGSGLQVTESGSKGDLAKTLDLTAAARKTAMEAAALDPSNATSFTPLFGFLNEFVYKGQAAAGFTAVQNAQAATPEALRTALITYATLLRRSQWFDDLNRLNDGQLLALLEQIESSAGAAP